eukprot:UN28887
MPVGTFTMVNGIDNEIGEQLVCNPNIQAVGFTGSFGAGTHLAKLASQRDQPIPVYSEMGSSNPIIIFTGAINDATKQDVVARELGTSMSLGVGQFCTQPGLVFMLKHGSSDQLMDSVAKDIKSRKGATMLTPTIAKNF